VAGYNVRVSYDLNFSLDPIDYSINIVRADARELDTSERFNAIVMDPPHFSEINYYELTYLWQLWLKGRYNDKRFTDFNYWEREIDVNLRVGRNINSYIESLAQIVFRYTKMLSKDGRLFLILHSSNQMELSKAIEHIKKYVNSIQYQEVLVKIPSSAQGIHRKPKQKLYLLND